MMMSKLMSELRLTGSKKAFAKIRKGLNLLMVPKAGLEPARRGLRLILSQVRLPIPPLRHLLLNNVIYNIMLFFLCQ